MAYTMDAAMADALGHLNRISSHLRKHDQHQAANEIGKLSIMIVEAFSEGIEQIPPSHFVFDDIVKAPTPLSITLEIETRTKREQQVDQDQHIIPHQAVSRDVIQKQAVMALMNEVEKDKRETANIMSGELQRIPAANASTRPPGSWAQVASSYSGLQAPPPSEATQFMSPLSMTSCSASKKSQNSDDDGGESATEPGMPLTSPGLPEIPEEKAGIIRIYGRISKDVVQFVTTRIHEGPLQDIRIETNERTRVIFQHASHALAFLKSNQEMEALLGFGRFGCGYHVELAEIVDWNEDHRRMNQPIRERRRLSFARKRLFADNMSPEKWKHDIRALAGPGNIDFLWVFNSGNATAVFTSTIVARKVLEVFNRWKEGRNVYSGVSVTFSSDPCEKELVLVKETNRPNIAKHLARRAIR
ncbi:hypothetical protein P175DRAFT_0554329 [Aspergillus ochraceoroseus IBT 24754]|uniref:Uncharacterized protein n=3 Tax=Aspergillus subgen. Nidulantes TaxID=2720870 RepID=A0A0F8VM70_9EURO|nr:uncharacterized protein P175DRAFT_0554329 [Aspergillus ochraceoroseus IBT 24754]KKK24166.1 hypothetical protein ARAM_004814 [Aspergillus rambellii]KKK25369.1 hypothetical protein AOCH_002492 [Aspergillus ochraceoroseus]PTU25081.1 hypothetical protein P175DRAFT_0554329 [Aspergillus ochraceoroseus IBT 24754]